MQKKILRISSINADGLHDSALRSLNRHSCITVLETALEMACSTGMISKVTEGSDSATTVYTASVVTVCLSCIISEKPKLLQHTQMTDKSSNI